MIKSNPSGVEKIATKRRKKLLANALLSRRPIYGVTDDRTAKRGKVHADLMGAARMQISFNQSVIPDMRKGAPVGACLASFATARGHARAAMQVASDGKLNAARFAPGFRIRATVKECDIFLGDKPIAEGTGESGVSSIAAGDDDGAGCFLIQPVNNSRPQRASHRRKPGGASETMEERSYERAVFRAGAGMNDHARGLVDHNDVFIFVENVERNRLRLDA